MSRIKDKDLIRLVSRINASAGEIDEPYTKDETGKMPANIGNYHLDRAYGGWALHRMLSYGGSVQDVSQMGHAKKKDIYIFLRGFLSGIQNQSIRISVLDLD